MHSCYNEPDYKKEGKVNCMIGYYNYTVILTYCSLISAIVGTHFAFEHNYVLALFCLMLCGFFDSFDGIVARSKKDRTEEEKKFGIQIEVEYPEDKIGKLFVDSEKIAWVLTNLLSNAIRYSSENSRVIIGARQVNGNKEIEMYVRDFGKGIDPRYHKSIFEHYLRVPGTKVQGSGLGLSISRDFVEAHGGTLTVESEIGKGSCFTLRLKA